MNINTNEFQEWVQPVNLGKDLVTTADLGKTGTIQAIRFSETKYGKRLAVDIKFDDGVEKTALLSRSKAKQLLASFLARDPNLQDINKWVGQRVKVETVNLMVRGEMKETVIILPA